MPHVITQNCCNDTACVAACPVDCIHPGPDEKDYESTEMLYIDPSACIDCGACIDVCPVNAISPDFALTDAMRPFEEINRVWFGDLDLTSASRRPRSVPAG
jgi:ferredoxin--NADP+ reductase